MLAADLLPCLQSAATSKSAATPQVGTMDSWTASSCWFR